MTIDTFGDKFKQHWSRALLQALPKAHDNPVIDCHILEDLIEILHAALPARSGAVKFDEDGLRDIICTAIQIAASMRLEPSRFVSIFPVPGTNFVPRFHEAEDSTNQANIQFCLFPGVVKQKRFLDIVEESNENMTVIRAKVYLGRTGRQSIPNTDIRVTSNTDTRWRE